MGKIRAFDATTGLPDKVTSDIGFTDEAVAQCDAPVTNVLL